MGIPWLERRRYGITCHDIISLALPELYLPRIPHWSVVYAGIERVRYGRATRILAVSECTRRDLCRFARISEDKIDVVHHGVDHARFHPRAEPGEREHVAKALGTDAPYVLYLGAGDVRKDLDTLVTAFAETRARKETHLVIAGNIGEGRTESLSLLATTLGVSDIVHFPGFVDEAIVPALYRQSVVHVFPSQYEGFGLPVLEALACGTPTITSPGSSLDEVAGDAASIIPCGDPPGLARALDDLVFDEARRGRLRDRGIERAAPFTWKRCAEATLDYYRRATA
jgi:glycosyltransferase involved in cell wall biosynthesis